MIPSLEGLPIEANEALSPHHDVRLTLLETSSVFLSLRGKLGCPALSLLPTANFRSM